MQQIRIRRNKITRDYFHRYSYPITKALWGPRPINYVRVGGWVGGMGMTCPVVDYEFPGTGIRHTLKG